MEVSEALEPVRHGKTRSTRAEPLLHHGLLTEVEDEREPDICELTRVHAEMVEVEHPEGQEHVDKRGGEARTESPEISDEDVHEQAGEKKREDLHHGDRQEEIADGQVNQRREVDHERRIEDERRVSVSSVRFRHPSREEHARCERIGYLADPVDEEDRVFV